MMQHPAFVRRAFDDTLDLMVEARNYLSYGDLSRHQSNDCICNLRRSCEAMRVTARLTNVMAWLMMQRAIADGEIEEEQALGPDPWLDDSKTCLATADATHLPTGLQSLLNRSLMLYARISRIEAQLRETVN